MTKTLTILLVDDSSAVRVDLRTLINIIEGIEITGEAQDAPSAILAAIDLNPDLVILDLQLDSLNRQELDGIELISELKTKLPQTRIFVLTIHGYDLARQQAVSAGADAFFVKGSGTDEMLQKIIDMHSNEKFFNQKIANNQKI